MGLLDFLKKNPPATEGNSAAKATDRPVSTPHPVVPVPSVPPAGTAVPTPKERIIIMTEQAGQIMLWQLWDGMITTPKPISNQLLKVTVHG